MQLVDIALVMVGLLLGFVGAGGSGFIISILTVVFGYPIHTALGTALAAMFFSSLSGSVSHYREGNMALKTGPSSAWPVRQGHGSARAGPRLFPRISWAS